MEIVIKIDADLYTRLFDNGEEYVADMRRACVAIRKGTVLPKGHGRLKDIDWIGDNSDIYYSDEDGSCCYAWEDIDNAPTIIEADKAGEEE